MVCILCHQKTQVINSRAQKKSNQTWRRRQCTSCDTVFTTEERPLFEQNWLVVDQKGASKPFLRDKLLISLHSSLKHRKSALEDASALTETIIHKLMNQVSNSQINRGLIIQTTQVALSRFDTAASINYQAFHPL